MTTHDTELAASIVRASLGSLNIPQLHHRVGKTTCLYTFDTPFSPLGLFLNILTHQSIGYSYLDYDKKTTNSQIYLQILTRHIPREESAQDQEDENKEQSNASNVDESGNISFNFASGPQEEQKLTLVLFPTVQSHFDEAIKIPFEPQCTSSLPEYFVTVVNALLGHAYSAPAEMDTWEDKPTVSKYADNLIQVPNPPKISPDPASWHCQQPGCDKNENLWLNLSDGFIGCGRKNWDGTGGNGHALQHFQETGAQYPLCVKLGTITAAGGDVYSYAPDEDDSKIDPHLGVHLAHFSINIMTLQKTEKSTAELTVNLNQLYDFSKITEAGKQLEPTTGPGRIGLQNLGNTCYINSILQLLASVPEWRDKVARERVLSALLAKLKAPKAESAVFATKKLNEYAWNSLSFQLAKALHYMHTSHYAADIDALDDLRRDLAVAATIGASPSTEASSGGKTGVAGAAIALRTSHAPGTRCGYLVLEDLRLLVGKHNTEFASGEQQDVVHFLTWFLELHDQVVQQAVEDSAGAMRTASGEELASYQASSQEVEGGKTGKSPQENAPTPAIVPVSADVPVALPLLQPYFAFEVEQRLQCASSGQVRYAKGSELCLRLNIPDEEDEGMDTDEAFMEAANVSKKPRRELSGSSNAEGSVSPQENSSTKSPKSMSFQSCLDLWGKQTILSDWLSPVTNSKGNAYLSQRIVSLPKYLLVVMNRYKIGADWTQKKINTRIAAPLEIDLASCGIVAKNGGGAQEGEVCMPDGSNAGANDSSDTFVPDETLLATLVSFGFGEEACVAAAKAVNNSGVEGAMEWILNHSDETGFHPPASVAPTTASEPQYDDASVAMIMEMTGASKNMVLKALKEVGGDLDHAVNWLFSQDSLEECLLVTSSESAPLEAPKLHKNVASSEKSVYALVGIVSHIGNSTSSGHYVAHKRIDKHGNPPVQADQDVEWVFYNDEKVALSQDPPVDAGYVYLYRRRD